MTTKKCLSMPLLKIIRVMGVCGSKGAADGGNETRDLHFNGLSIGTLKDGYEDGQARAFVSWRVWIIGEMNAEAADVGKSLNCKLSRKADGGVLYLGKSFHLPEAREDVDDVGVANNNFIFGR